MDISTLDDLVYVAALAADNDYQPAENNAANNTNITNNTNKRNVDNLKTTLSLVPSNTSDSNNQIDSVKLSKIPISDNQLNSFLESSSVLPNNWQTQTLLPSDYMNDFFTDQNPFGENQLSAGKIQITNSDISNANVKSDTINTINTAVKKIEKSSTSDDLTNNLPELPISFLQLEHVDNASDVTGIDWNIQQIEREISKTLFPKGIEDAAKIAFDLVDINSRNRNTNNSSGNKNANGSNNINLSVTEQSLKPLRGLSREFDVSAIRKDFPILSERVHGKPLIWFDNGATTQKPLAVIERLQYFYEHENSNVHRGVHDLAARSTDAYERAREITRKFLNASSANEIVFVRGTTEAINLVAAAWGKDNIHAGDEIVISHLEHHANIVPWQMLASEVGAVIRVIPVNAEGELLISNYTDILRKGKTKLVAVTQVSNAIGTITPTEEIVKIAHQFGAKVLIDGAQSVSHLPTDLQMLDADFFVFSGHKIFAPMGIGVLYGRESILNSMRPYQGGGGMISDVTFERTIYNPAPGRFEAGTGNIADAVGLGAALDYVGSIGMESIRRYEELLLDHAVKELSQIEGVKIIGNAVNRAAVISFLVDGFTTDEINKILAAEGIAVRAGHHCAQPILRRFGVESTIRASLAFYNKYEEIDSLVKIIKDIVSG